MAIVIFNPRRKLYLSKVATARHKHFFTDFLRHTQVRGGRHAGELLTSFEVLCHGVEWYQITF